MLEGLYQGTDLSAKTACPAEVDGQQSSTKSLLAYQHPPLLAACVRGRSAEEWVGVLRALWDDSAWAFMVEGSRQVGRVSGLEMDEGDVEGEGLPPGEEKEGIRLKLQN